jgi:hypothetical protein
MVKGKYWSPYLAGVGLGLALLATFYIAGWGLGASSAFSILTGVGLHGVLPEFAENLDYFAPYYESTSPLMNWIIFLVIGVFLGGLAGSLPTKNFKFQFDKASWMNNKTRFFIAISGGIMIGFASRLARGCTSGLALSGSAQMALSGWIFVLSMFITGFIATRIYGRIWQ